MEILSEKGKVGKNFYIGGNVMLPSYIVKSDRIACIDTGMTIIGPVLYQDILELGEGREVLNPLTHSHFDHCGSTPYLLRKFPDMKVISSPLAKEVLKKESAISLIKSLNEDAERKAGVVNGRMGDELISFETFEVHITVKEGDEIDLGKGVRLRVMEAPGHTRDTLCYHLLPDNAIFAGEAYGVPDMDGFIHPQFLIGYSIYINSIKKMMEVEPSYIGLAHGGVIVKGAKAFLKRSIEDAERFREVIERALKESNFQLEETIKKITEKYYDPSRSGQTRRAYILNLTAMVRVIAREFFNKEV